MVSERTFTIIAGIIITIFIIIIIVFIFVPTGPTADEVISEGLVPAARGLLESCTESKQCEPGLVCYVLQCRKQGDADCNDDNECAFERSCISGKCKSELGGICTVNEDCVSPLICDDINECKVVLGGSCTDNTDCEIGSLCVAGECN